MSKVLLKVNKVPVYEDEDGSVHWMGEMTIDADGCPHAYGPKGVKPPPLDWLSNAGYPGNWWGIVDMPNGQPFEQKHGNPDKWPWPGFYVSTTAYEHPAYDKYDCRKYVDSEHVEFMVVPGSVRLSVKPKFMGCRAVITDKKDGTTLECVCADVGPARHLGEASMAAAKALGVNSDPKKGGSSDRKRWHYRCWPGVPADGWELV